MRLAGYLCITCTVAMMLLNGCACGNRTHQASSLAPSTTQDEREGGGVRVERISLTAAGMMLDMRYRILDYDEARQFLNRSSEMHLVDQASGKRLPVPNMAKVGRLRQLPGKDSANKVHWVFFSNPGIVMKGSKVTLVMGDVRIGDITVD